MCLRLVAALTFVSCLPCAAKKVVSIDDMLAYSASSGPNPVWSSDGRSFAYERDGAIYRYDVRHRKAKELVSLAVLQRSAKHVPEPKAFNWQNRRVFERKLQWLPNGSDLLVYAEQDLFLVHPNGEFEQVTVATQPVESPELSPDGNAVLYRAAHNLFVLDLHTRESRQLTNDGSPTLLDGEADWVYPEELDLHQAAWWSPDSKHIAYLQFNVADEFSYPQTDLLGRSAIYEPERYPQAGTPNARVKLGIIPAAGGGTVWAQAGDSPDVLLARAVWFPDSSAVALETLPRVQNKLDLLRCDAATGAVTTLIHEESKDWINYESNLHFLTSRPEFLWTSERSGFRHIYRFGYDGRLLGQLTQGDWEVKQIAAVDERAGQIYFNGSADTPLETHLYRVSIEGGSLTRVTEGGFDHDVHVSPSGELFVDTFSSLSAPPKTVLRNRSGDQISVLQTNDNPADEYVIQSPEIASFRTADGAVLYGKLYKPAGFDRSTKWPLVVSVYGGPGAQAVRNHWTGLGWQQVLAARGYLVWELDNRGSTGRGHKFEAAIFHNMGEAEVADQRKGVEYLLAQGYVDPKRIGITGWSYGGFMTIHSLLLAPNLFKVGVAGAPVTDWRNYDTIYTERYMGLPSGNSDGYDDASNVENASLLQGNLLIVHNFEDDNVLLQNTMQFILALEQEGKPYSLNLYGQKTHHVGGRVERQLYETMTNFFDRNLK